MEIVFHHVGCVVRSIPESVEAYRLMTRSVSETKYIAAQDIRACFIEIAPGSYIELIEPASNDSVVSQLLQKRVSYYHTGYLVRDFEAALEELTSCGHRHLNTFQSESFGLRNCAFLVSPVAHLIEIIQAE